MMSPEGTLAGGTREPLTLQGRALVLLGGPSLHQGPWAFPTLLNSSFLTTQGPLGHTLPPPRPVPYHLVLPGPRPSNLLGPLRTHSGTRCWPGICPLPPKGPHSQMYSCGQVLGSVWSPQGLAQAPELGRWHPLAPSQASQLPGPRCHPLPTK